MKNKKKREDEFEDDDNFNLVAFLTKTLLGKEDVSNKSSKPKGNKEDVENENVTI